MKGIRYAEGLKVIANIASQNMTSSAVTGTEVALREAHWVTYLIQLGAFTSDSTDTVTITVESATGTSTNSNDEGIAFSYRLGAAKDSDSMGAITAATSDGVAFGADSDDSKVIVIDVDPQYVAAKDTDAGYVRLVLTPTADVAGLQVAAVAVIEPRYPGNTMNSAVA